MTETHRFVFRNGKSVEDWHLNLISSIPSPIQQSYAQIKENQNPILEIKQISEELLVRYNWVYVYLYIHTHKNGRENMLTGSVKLWIEQNGSDNWFNSANKYFQTFNFPFLMTFIWWLEKRFSELEMLSRFVR